MSRVGRACAVLSVVVAAAMALLLPGRGSAASGVSCEETVLGDWSDNGRIDGMYPLRCYQEAIDKMPADLRDYTNASDAIQRALTRAVNVEDTRSGTSRVASGTAPELGASGSSGLPLPLVGLAAICLTVLAAGGLGYWSRRRQAHAGDSFDSKDDDSLS